MHINSDNTEELFIMSFTLAGVVKQILENSGEIRLSSDPLIEKRPITSFTRRMRVFGMEKFDAPTFIGVINFYRNNDDLRRHRALGVLLVYIGQNYIYDLFKKLNYPEIDDEDDEALQDACGTLCNLIAGQFKSEVVRMGYESLEMSPFSHYRNNAFYGVEYDTSSQDKFEISFFIRDLKQIVVELAMGPMHLKKKKTKALAA